MVFCGNDSHQCYQQFLFLLYDCHCDGDLCGVPLSYDLWENSYQRDGAVAFEVCRMVLSGNRDRDADSSSFCHVCVGHRPHVSQKLHPGSVSTGTLCTVAE